MKLCSSHPFQSPVFGCNAQQVGVVQFNAQWQTGEFMQRLTNRWRKLYKKCFVCVTFD